VSGPVIDRFTGEYHFLSNFAATPFEMPGMAGGLVWPTAEHCYQAAKSPTLTGMEMIRNAPTPAAAKGMGRAAELPAGWDRVKKTVMMQIILAKFSRNPELTAMLCATRGRELIEGNTWGDDYWGAVQGGAPPMWHWGHGWYGNNWLGRILMMARDVMDPLA
jgi:ribA/ribD-fused uncharacterized protein